MYVYIIKLIEIIFIRSNNHATMIRIYKFVLFEFETRREKTKKKFGHYRLTIALSR